MKLPLRVAIVLTLITVLISCTNQDSNGVMLKRAERQMTSAPYHAMVLIDSIPDSILFQPYAPRGHYSQCLTVARYNKTCKCLQSNDIEKAKQWLRLVIMQAEDEKDKQQAVGLLEKLVVLTVTPENDSLKENLVTELLATDSLVQHHSEEHVASARKAVLNKPLYWISVILLLIAIAVLLFVQHKQSKYKAIQDFQKEINHLNKQARRMSENTSERLGVGKQIYDNVTGGGSMKNISIEHEQCFIDFYAFSFPQEYAGLVAPYLSLSLRHTTYLILKRMGYNDNDIQTILFVKASTIRSYRLRIEKNRKA